MAKGDRGTLDLLSRVSTDYDKKDSLETDGSESALREEQAIRNQNKDRQHSMLSPLNEANKEVSSDNYVSPFSDEFLEKSKVEDEKFKEEVEETSTISSNRIQAFAMMAAVLYVIALGIGYHYTPYEDGVPQVIAGNEIDASEYLGSSNEYILNIQTYHASTVDSVEKFTTGLMGANELASSMKKDNEKLAKKLEEVKEMTAPEGYDSFQSDLIELYSLQISMNAAAINYATGKTQDTFDVVSNINNKYLDKEDTFLHDFDSSFQH